VGLLGVGEVVVDQDGGQVDRVLGNVSGRRVAARVLLEALVLGLGVVRVAATGGDVEALPIDLLLDDVGTPQAPPAAHLPDVPPLWPLDLAHIHVVPLSGSNRYGEPTRSPRRMQF